MCTHSTTRETHGALIEAPRSATKSARSLFGPFYAGPMVRRGLPGMPAPGVETGTSSYGATGIGSGKP
jgi:hypothetical protein